MSIRFPIDPNLKLGYATFSNPQMWVSAIVSNTSKPYVQIAIPPLGSKSDSLSATLVFRPGPKAKAGATIFSRYTVFWDDLAMPSKKQLSTGVRLGLSSDNTSRNDSNGAVALLNPATLDVKTGATYI